METYSWIIICIVCLIAGFVIAYMIESKKTAKYNEENINIKAQLSSEQRMNNQLEDQNKALSEKNEALNVELQKALSASAAEAEKTKWTENADKSLREAFNALSKEIIDRNNTVFLEKANDKLNDFASKLDEKMTGENKEVSNIINPVSDQLKELQKQVGEMEKLRESAYTGLNQSVNALKEQSEILKSETQNLNSALRNSSVRGKWGEAQLHRIAELAGMTEHIDFEVQYVNEDGLRPDMMINLAGNRSIPVDSKAPMDDYLRYVESNDKTEKSVYLKKHVQAVKKHIDELKKKEYWKSEERSVDYVVMMIPYESGLSSIFEEDKDIFEYAILKNVLLLSPMTFFAFLKSVSLGWTERNMAENAKEIAKVSTELCERIEKYFDHMADMGKNLDKTVQKYNDAINSYNKRLLPEFNKLYSLKTRTLPAEIKTIDEAVNLPQEKGEKE